MNSDANEFFPSSETGTRSTTFDEGDHFFTVLKTNHQIATARSILHEWSRARTLSALTHEWSSWHENQLHPNETVAHSWSTTSGACDCISEILSTTFLSPIQPSGYSLGCTLTISSTINSLRTSRLVTAPTINNQHGSNDFGGVCLAIAREVPHWIVPEFHKIDSPRRKQRICFTSRNFKLLSGAFGYLMLL